MCASPTDGSGQHESAFAQLLRLARDGDRCALGELIQDCRAYLLLVANRELDQDLRAKLGGSDLVQETLLTAQHAFDQFEGENRDELIAWLRAILKNDIKGARRQYKGIQKRTVDRESPLDSRVPHPSDQIHTPSSRAVIEEETEMVKAAMGALSNEYREVLELRNWQRMTFSEIGTKMNRSEEAARKLWARALVQLKRELAERHVE